MLSQLSDQIPHLAEMLTTVMHHGVSTLGWCDSQFEFEFEFALDLILDGLEAIGARG